MPEPLIRVENLYKVFGNAPQSVMPLVRAGRSKDDILAKTGHTVGLRDISLDIEKGSIFVVMGLSGSGKSTLIRHFNRLIDPTEGAIYVDGTDVMSLSRTKLEEFRRNNMSMVFQRFGLMPHRTVLENVAFGLTVRKVPRAVRKEKAREWVRTVGLDGYEDHYPAQLSGGEQQRVGLARALCTDPEILLMDEPFSALDPLIRSGMQDRLIGLQDRLHKTIVFITHDLDEALRLGDKIAILKDGELSQVGRPEEILLEPADAYVEAFVRDVNRARVLTVGMVMMPAGNPLTTTDIDEALAQMRRQQKDHAHVFQGGDYKGLVTRKALEEASESSSGPAPHLHEIAEQGPTLGPNTILQDALPVTLNSDYPVPVVSEDGAYQGTLSKHDIVDILANSNARLSDTGTDSAP